MPTFLDGCADGSDRLHLLVCLLGHRRLRAGVGAGPRRADCGVVLRLRLWAGGLGAALLGVVADHQGINFVFQLCSYMPLLGILTVLLPKLPSR